jgi:hypothetical protein
MKAIATIILCGTVYVAGTAWANTDLQTKLFNDYITLNKTYVTKLTHKHHQIFKHTYPECHNTITIKRLKPQIKIKAFFETPKDISDDVDISSLSYHPAHGQWIEKAKLGACGKTIISNNIVIGYSSSRVAEISPLVNGQTRIDPIFQRKAEAAISKALKTPTIACHSEILAIDTQFLGYPSQNTNALVPSDDNAGWFEKWTVTACRKTHDVNLAILPDARTTYRYLARIQK